MTTIPQPSPAHPSEAPQQEQTDHLVPAVPATLPDLSTPSTLWMPLDATIQEWASFARDALTCAALLAVGSAYHGLAWETKALRHATWAAQERERGRGRKVIFWLRKAVEDLDCALDQWNQALAWLDIAGNDDQQQDPASLDTIRTLIGHASEHQGRRRALHRHLVQEYARAKEREQEGRVR